jgi:hypothetical protein
MFKVGDKVMLRADHKYTRGKYNPTGVVGTIEEGDDFLLLVRWEGLEEVNSYISSDLYYPHKLGRLLAGVEDAEITK